MDNKETESLKIIIDGDSKEKSKKWKEKNIKLSDNTLASSHSSDFKISELMVNSHPVLMGYLKGYSDHFPMVISPDIIWQLILLGFSQHVDQNYEKLRNKFVDFKGKEKITVERLNLTPETATKEDWEDIVNEFCSKINEKVNKNLVEILTPNFSTTDNISKATGQISILSSMKNYFDYECMMCGCGIPYINLKGSLEDWENLIEKVKNLEKYDLEWWTKELIPVLNKIIETKKVKENEIDKKFWGNFIKIRKEKEKVYGPSGMNSWIEEKDYIDGWIIKFFPYNKIGYKYDFIKINQKKNLPDPVNNTPMILKLVALGISLNTVWNAGFIGVKQDPITLEVEPVIGWNLIQEEDKKKNFDF